ncbi:MAG: DEAD/DEAH box helicase family protein [Polyangiales bacterium]
MPELPDLHDGLYDQLVTFALDAALRDPRLTSERVALNPGTAPEELARHVAHFAAARLSSLKGKDDHDRTAKQIELTNQLLALVAGLGGDVDTNDHVLAERLLQVRHKEQLRLGAAKLMRPTIPLRYSDLIVNGPKDLRVGHEIERELASADRVDVLVSFVKWSGFVELRDALRAFCDRHRLHSERGPAPRLRVLTTTYMGATEPEALDALKDMGAEVRVSYDTRRTRLHAKAWLFHRVTGFSTGIVGSSNLSHAALRDGCEWNVRLSNVDNAGILRKFEATFAQYWNEEAFEPYERERFARVVEARRSPERDALAEAIRLHPYPHQTAVLDALSAERSAGHSRNLVVAATGTGKTVIAALDYKRLPGRPSLLFVAHRREILEKSRARYRAALGDGSFGELHTGGDKPLTGKHVFASIQSLHARRLKDLAPDAYDVLVVDEFHHAEAESYTALLNHLRPRVLLGMTATPERADGRSILHWFDGRVAAESRWWDALDQGLLVPFQYFGVDDPTDLSQIDFTKGRYSVSALERVYTADEHRAKQVLRALHDRVRDPGGCARSGSAYRSNLRRECQRRTSVAPSGLPAESVTGDTAEQLRSAAISRLIAGELCTLFTVDLFNEGVDIPAVDTVLFLARKASTLYLQQARAWPAPR